MGHIVQTPHSGLQWNGSLGNFFEGWYFRLTLPDHCQTFAFIYTIHNPGAHQPFSGGTAQVLGPDNDFFRRTFPDLQHFWAWPRALGLGHWRKLLQDQPPGYLSPTRFDAQIEEGYQATATWHQGKLSEPALGKQVRWQYSIEPVYGWGATHSVQRSTTGWLSKFRWVDPGWQVLMAHGLATGWIEWDGERYSFTQVPAYSEKNWGSAFPEKWFWVNCNVFTQVSDLSITAAGGQQNILGWSTPVAMIGVHYQEQFYEFVPWTSKLQWEVHPWGYWSITARNAKYIVEVTATAMHSTYVMMHVPTANGTALDCQDTTRGHLIMKLWRIHQDHLELLLTAESDFACLEVGGTGWESPWCEGSLIS
jgi:tocopherol cyclase